MKTILAGIVAALAFVFSAHAAEATVKISQVHMCCGSCVNDIEAAVGKVKGVKVAADKSARTVDLTAADNATLQKAANELVKAGYFGTSSSSEVKMNAKTGAKGQKVQSLTVNGVHLCCAKCVKAVDEAVKTVPGVTSHSAAPAAKSFKVVGDFNDQAVFDALNKAGLAGVAGR